MNKKDLGSAALQVNWRIPEWFQGLNDKTKVGLKSYHEVLMRLNKTVNLVATKALGSLDAVHFSDSIMASQLIMASAKVDEIYDLGSGNGFPGIVFAILYPEVGVKLVEFDTRKADCLKQAATELGLKNVEVLVRKMEDLPEGTVRFGMCREFGTIAKTLVANRRPFAKGGKLFHLKGEEWAREVAEIPTQLCSFWLPSLVKEYKLPIGAAKFAVVLTDKISQ